MKKIETMENKELVKDQSFNRNRSISRVKLPSLDQKKQPLNKSHTREELQKSTEIREKIKSMKQIPKIKV